MELFRIPELAVHILAQCETYTQLLALASTCTHLHSIWRLHRSRLIWAVGLKSRPAFNDALMAVRATAIVRDAVLSGSLPPDPFPFAELSGWSRAPTNSEMDEVFLLEHLVRCIEYKASHTKDRDGFLVLDPFFRRPSKHTPELRQWRNGFYRAVYRSFLAGAVFYRAYNEPVRMVKEKRPERVLDGFATWYRAKLEGRRPADWAEGMTTEDLSYFSGFPAYDLNLSEEKLQAQLGPLAEWMIQDSKTRARGSGDDCPGYPFAFAKNYELTKHFDEGEVAAIWETLQFVSACRHVRTKFANVGNRFGFKRFQMFDLITPPSGIKEVNVILFGIFRLEVISTPVRYRESATELKLLVADSLTPSTDPIDDIDIPCLFDSLYIAAVEEYDFQVAPDYLYETLRPDLRLSTFILRKHFGLQFQSYDEEDDDESFWKVVWSESTFSGRRPTSPRAPHDISSSAMVIPTWEILAAYHPST